MRGRFPGVLKINRVVVPTVVYRIERFFFLVLRKVPEKQIMESC